MGFTKPPNQAYDKILFVNNCQGYPWSWLDNVPCKELALEGKVVGLQIRQSEYKDKVSEKLHLLIKDDEFTYCIRCGLETVFSRGLLLSLRVCLSQQADCQIIISPKVSERDARVIFCNLWANNQRVKIDWDKDINLYSLAQELSRKYFPDLPLEKEDHEEPISETSVPATGEVDFQTLLAKNDADLKYLGLSPQEARQMLIDKYGKRSRHLLTNEELIDFVAHVKGLTQKKMRSQLFDKSHPIPDDCPF